MPTTQVSGVSDLLKRLANAAALGEQAAAVTKATLAEDVAETARSIVPVDTGVLQDSIAADADGVHTDVDYAPFVEYGTFDTPAQPYMRPAADTTPRDRAEEAGAEIMRRA